MDKNRKYNESDEEYDDFTGQSNPDEQDNPGGYGGQHDHVDLDGDDVGDLGTDYEDLEDQWYDIETDYRERYPDLTDDDVKVQAGRFDQTLDRIGRRTERSPDQVRQDIENWR